MPDDRKKPSRAGSVSDADRAHGGRARRQGIPAHVDEELTPPPISVEDLRRNKSGTMPPTAAKQLAWLTEKIGEVRSANNGDRLDRIDEKLGAIAKYTTRHQTLFDDVVLPMLKAGTASNDALAQQMPRVIHSLEQATLTLTSVDKRLRDLEVQMLVDRQRHESNHEAMTARVASLEIASNKREARIGVIERTIRDREVTTVAVAKAERRKIKGGAGIVAAVVSAAGAVASHIFR